MSQYATRYNRCMLQGQISEAVGITFEALKSTRGQSRLLDDPPAQSLIPPEDLLNTPEATTFLAADRVSEKYPVMSQKTAYVYLLK